LNIDDIRNLRDWGINMVRMGVIWEGVEIEKGIYNMSYLNEMEILINELGEYGIYTMIDIH